MDNFEESKIKSLLLRGFTKDEISKLTNIPITEIENVNITNDIQINSADLYSDLQKDLAKLVFKEMQKADSDGNIILNSIKLQAELQEKKVVLNRSNSFNSSKMSKSYIKDRDKEIETLFKSGKSKVEIATKFGISPIMVERAIDRCDLQLTDEIWENIEPSIIDETVSLDNSLRVKIINEAYQNKFTKRKVREMVQQIKNEIKNGKTTTNTE